MNDINYKAIINFQRMSVIPRIRKNLLGSVAPVSIPRKIKDLLESEDFNKIKLCPCYQRDIRWSPEAMNDFIGTIMNNGLVPGVIMYELQPEDKVEQDQGKYDFEVVDGQHRLYTLNAFKSSKLQILPNIKKPFIVHWCYETTDEVGTKNVQRVFYENTEEVQTWYRDTYKQGAPYFLTEDEKKVFNKFTICITTLCSSLSMDHRREIFMSLQKGIPVRNSDYLKNMTSCKLIKAFEEYGCQQKMTDVFFERCSKKSLKYQTHWATRCFLLFKRSKEVVDDKTKPTSETFLIPDSKINKMIRNNLGLLNPTDEVLDNFKNIFENFISFLQMQDEGIMFNPTQMFAIFNHFCVSSNVDKDILKTHMKVFSKEGAKKKYKNMWECKNVVEPRRDYFNHCVAELESMVEVAIDIDDRPITKKMKMQVFKKCVDGKCAICEETEINKKCFEVGHIQARELGGQGELDNLLPMCFDCNRSMGTRNALEYKRDVFPHLFGKVKVL